MFPMTKHNVSIKEQNYKEKSNNDKQIEKVPQGANNSSYLICPFINLGTQISVQMLSMNVRVRVEGRGRRKA